MFIHQNISAPATLLDSPTRERFVQELTTHDYDIVGISSIVVNVGKVREMCRLVRQHSPRSTIVVGGHPSVSARIRALRLETEREFGAMATLINRPSGLCCCGRRTVRRCAIPHDDGSSRARSSKGAP